MKLKEIREAKGISQRQAMKTPTLKAVGSNPAGRTKKKPRNLNDCGVLLCADMCGYVPSCAFEKVQKKV